MIAPCQHHLREQLKIETPWLSYVGDYEEGEGLCRLYAYTLNDHGFPVAFAGEWVATDAIDERNVAHAWVADAIERWLDPTIIRGKGLSQAQSRIDQFAY